MGDQGGRSSAWQKGVRDVRSLTIDARLTVVARDAKWKVATRVHKVADFAEPTEVAKSVECLAAPREPNVLAYATCTVGFVVVLQKAARRRTAATAFVFRTEEADGAKQLDAVARFVR